MTPQQALSRLQMQCSRSEFCSAQIKGKLSRWRTSALAKGKPVFTEEEAEEILRSLVEGRYVDDVRFAGAYVRDKARFSKWGAVKISYALRKLGIGDSIIRCAIEDNQELFSGDVLHQLLQKRWQQMKAGDPLEARRAKLLRFALGRGYGYGQIMEIIKDFR